MRWLLRSKQNIGEVWLPTTACSGCGHGYLVAALVKVGGGLDATEGSARGEAYLRRESLRRP